MSMTSGAKHALATTIRSLRARLLDDLHAATETAYRLSVPSRDAGLDEAARARRGRLEAWVAEQVRAQDAAGAKRSRSKEDFRREAEKQAAYTLLNRLILLRLMEAPGPSGQPLRAPAVVTGGWESRAYLDFRDLAPGIVRDDETEGYAFLLRLVFEDLATELPGLYGPAGVADLVPVPAATLRHVIDALNSEALESCWADDMTLGWVYQYWNDPEREALDDKLNGGGKVEPYEIASKTQMFTERYMVDWLLQNSLGPMWLAICQRHGWTPEVAADGTLDRLEERRADWRAKRASGEVTLTDLMPLHTDAERRWAYYVPQPIPESAVAQAPETIRDLRLLDPAVGSGHFLVVALDLLVALYREEARHRGEAGEERWSDRAIVERILSHNLHGIDLDPTGGADRRGGPLAQGPAGSPRRPARAAEPRGVEPAPGEPGRRRPSARRAPPRGGARDGHPSRADRHADPRPARRRPPGQPAQGGHGGGRGPGTARGRAEPGGRTSRATCSPASARNPSGSPSAAPRPRATLLDRLEGFLARHTGGDDLGLRLRGEQLAAGVRFVRLVREGTYDLVVANPPYQGTGKMADTQVRQPKTYPLGKADLYAAFLLRGLELVRDGGFAAQCSPCDGWMFLKQYAGLRESYNGGTFDPLHRRPALVCLRRDARQYGSHVLPDAGISGKHTVRRPMFQHHETRVATGPFRPSTASAQQSFAMKDTPRFDLDTLEGRTGVANDLLVEPLGTGPISKCTR